MRTTAGPSSVEDYLRQLDFESTSLSLRAAAELRREIAGHLAEAVPVDADELEVARVLDRLGSPKDLVNEVAATGGGGGRVRRGLSRARRARRSTWVVVGLALALTLSGTSYLLLNVTAPNLETAGSYGWWYAADYWHEVDSQIGGLTQSAVARRPGQLQGFAFAVTNQSDWTQHVIGSTTQPLLGGPGEVLVSRANRDIELGGFTRAVQLTVGGSIPPHQTRMLLLLWRSTECIPKGGVESIDQISLEVGVGLINHVEIVQLPTTIALLGGGGC